VFHDGYLVTCNLPTSGLEPVSGANHVDYQRILTRDYLPIYRRAWSKLAHMPVVHPSPLPYFVEDGLTWDLVCLGFTARHSRHRTFEVHAVAS
jgi:hypothetical protein